MVGQRFNYRRFSDPDGAERPDPEPKMCTVEMFVLQAANMFATVKLYTMVTYFTTVWNLSTTTAASIINIFYGATSALIFIFAHIVDDCWGAYNMIVTTGTAYSIGLILLTLSTAPFFGPCREYKEECIGHIQKVLMYVACPLLLIGHQVRIVLIRLQETVQHDQAQPTASLLNVNPQPETINLSTGARVGEIQTLRVDAGDSELRTGNDTGRSEPLPGARDGNNQPSFGNSQPQSAFQSLLPNAIIVVILSSVLLFVKPWYILFGLSATLTSIATTTFVFQSSTYYKGKANQQSPTRISVSVFFAALSKEFFKPTSYEDNYSVLSQRICTNKLRWFNKAARKLPDQPRSKSSTLCTVDEVEDTKTVIRMVPILITFIGTGMVLSLEITYFLEQANHMDPIFKSVQICFFTYLVFIMKLISTFIYGVLEKCFPGKYFAPIGIGISMVLSVSCCIFAAFMETERLLVIRNHGLLDKPNQRIPKSKFSLVLQFLILGAIDGIQQCGMTNFIRGRVPESMHEHLHHLRYFFLGLGNFAAVLMDYIVSKITEKINKDWFQQKSYKIHLDLYYWILAVLSAVNLVVYILIASCCYKYKEVSSDNVGGDIPLAEVQR